MLNFRKSSLSIKQQLVNLFNRKRRKNGKAEMANFDFRLFKEEEKQLILSASSTSSYSSCSSPVPSLDTEAEDLKPKSSSAVKAEKIFLYILPFIIVLVCFV